MASKKMSPITWVGILTAAVAAYSLAGSNDTTKKKTTPPKTQAKSTKADIYMKADYDANFARIDQPVKNAFHPIVATQTGAATGPTGPVNIPVELTGGGSWSYTGNADVDGVRMALVEDSTTGEGAFVKVGQAWKHTQILGIGSEQLELRGLDGGVVSFKLGQPTVTTSTPQSAANVPGFTPVNPRSNLTGPIGNLSVAQDPSQAGQSAGGGNGGYGGYGQAQQDSQATQGNPQGQGNGGRRRRRGGG